MISVVIPCYKEHGSLELLLPELRAKMPPCELLVVQDGPDDGTQALCRSMAIRCVRGRNQGLGPAIALGIIVASHNRVIVMDGDGQHPVSAVAEIANQLAEGDPLVFGVRDKGKGMPWVRSFMSDACALLTRPLCDMRDPMTGLFGLDRRIVQNKNLNPNTWKIGLEIAAKTGINGTPIMYKFRSRIAGESKASIKPAMQFLIQLIKLYLWKVDLGQMLKFCVVGTSGLVVNMGLLMGMVEMFGMDYRPAAIIGIGIAMVWNYAWNKAWTFRRGNGQVNGVREGADSIGKRQGKATSG